MRIVFMGTPDFSVGALRALYEAGHEVAGVVTQPDKPKGRGKSLAYPPVKEEALKLGLPVYQPSKVRAPEFLEVLKGLKPDVIVVVAFGQIIPKSILELAPYGCINVHASLLPKYRGAAPIQRAVIDGEKVSGVTIMRMDEGLDTGDMISKAEVELSPEETGGSLFEKLSDVGARLLVETLPAIFSGEAVYEVQPKESPTPYAGMISKQEGCISWEKSAEEIERLVRGLNPWPSAYTYLDGKGLKIWRSHVAASDDGRYSDIFDAAAGKKPGDIVGADKRGICVKTGDGLLCIDELQLEGKKRMTADAFLRGYAVDSGAKLQNSR
ncbi:MAG: methionyl-tRNA formyltransferase [Blautia sp.]|jgi:methionyl-tRNA formyltransferase